MKTKLTILILIFITSLNCQNSNFKLEGNWIGIYSLLDKSSQFKGLQEDYFEDTIQSKKILSFETDSMVLSVFNQSLYYGFNQDKFKFKLESDSIRLGYKGDTFALDYSYTQGFFMIDLYDKDRIKYRDHFIQIEEYGMSDKEKEISTFLINHPIIIGQRNDKIELATPHWNHMGEFIQDNLKADYGYNNDWYICTIKKELFLIIGDYLMHVKKFDKEKIICKTYDRKINEIEIKRSKYTKQFDHEFLNGNWVQKKDYKISEDSDEIFQLEINDKKIIVNSKIFSDTIEWNINKFGNKILIERDYHDRHGKYWKIEKLSKNELVIKRKLEENIKSRIETLALKKK